MTAPVFCTSTRAPAAMPRRCGATVPIIAAVLGDVEHARADPDDEHVDAGPHVAGVALQGGHQRQAEGGHEHPHHRQHPRSAAIGPDAGRGRGDQHPEGQRGELDAGQDRRVALDALEVEDEHEHQREPRQSVGERRSRGGGEQAVAEDRQVEHRRRVPALDQHERGQQHGGRDQRRDHQRRAPPLDPALGDAVDEPGQPDEERERPQVVERAVTGASRSPRAGSWRPTGSPGARTAR